MSFKLITKPNGVVTARNDVAKNRGVFGDLCALGFGEKLRYEIVNNNTLRVYDGVLMIQGLQMQIDPNTYEEFTFENGQQGVTRYDMIGFEVTTGAEYTIEKFVEENVGADAAAEFNDLWAAPSGTKTQAGLYLVKFEGLSLVEVTQLFLVCGNLSGSGNEKLQRQITGGYEPPSGGKHGDVYIQFIDEEA